MHFAFEDQRGWQSVIAPEIGEYSPTIGIRKQFFGVPREIAQQLRFHLRFDDGIGPSIVGLLLRLLSHLREEEGYNSAE